MGADLYRRLVNPIRLKTIRGADPEDRWMNSGILHYGDGYLMAVRRGWNACQIYLMRFTRQWEPIGEPTRLFLNHPACRDAQEDPRLFMFRDKIHVSFSGVVQSFGDIEHVSMLYARLGDDLTAEEVFHVDDPAFHHWEKNHVFFENDGVLCGIYRVGPPHLVYEVEEGRISRFHSDDFSSTFIPATVARGSTPPIRMGAEYYHLFHSKYQPIGHKPRYCTGLYTFDAKPPFTVRRMTPLPFLEGDPKTNEPGSGLPDVLFTCGAIIQDDWMILSSGEHDRSTVIHAVRLAELEAALVPV